MEYSKNPIGGMLPVDVRPAAPEEETDFDLRALLATLWRGKWILIVCALAGYALTYLYASQIEPRYRASALVLFNADQTNVVDLQEIVSNNRNVWNEQTNQMEILRSSVLIENVIRDLKLDQHPEFNAALRPPPTGFKVWLKDKLDPRPMLRDLGVLTPTPAGAPLTAEEEAAQTMLRVRGAVRAGMVLEPVPDSDLINISFVSGDPRLSARVVNAITQRYITNQLEAKLEATRKATVWLSDRVEELRLKVESSERAIEDYRARVAAESGQSPELLQKQLDDLNSDLVATRSLRTVAEARYRRVAAGAADFSRIGSISEFLNSSLIQRHRQTEVELLGQEAALAASLPDDHPRLAEVRARLAFARRNIELEAERVVESLKAEYEIAAGREAALTEAVRAQELRVQELAGDEVQLRQLEREAQANRILYENFLARLKETSEQATLQQADARVLSPADVPGAPEAFERKAITTAGAVGGLALGALIIFLISKLNNTFRSLNDVTEATGLTVLGAIPIAGRFSKRQAVLEHLRLKPSSALAEAVRNLRTSILFSNIDKPPKVVMLTSSVPREGKSTTLMMLALTSVHMGRSSIIVDCDLRLPSLAALLEQNDSPGLLAVMEGTARLEDAIVVEPVSGLHILSARPENKPITSNAADILSSERFASLIRRLRQQYELVILDTPPVLSVSDARIVSSLADAVIYAIRWDKTTRAEVKEGLEEFASIGCPVTGAVVTMIDETRASSYGYSNYGYHRGKYKEYYTE